MKNLAFILFLFTNGLLAQSNKFIGLQIKHVHSTKFIKFYEKDKFTFKLKQGGKKHSGVITALSDSVIVLDTNTIVFIKDIKVILVDNSNYVTKVSSRFLISCGIGFITLDSFNNLINNDKPIIKPVTLAVGASLILIGETIKWLSVRHYKINAKHVVKFIDDTP